MRRRLLTSYLLLTFFVLLVLEVPLAVSYESRAREQLTTGLQRDAFVLAAFAEDAVQGNGNVDLQQLVTNYQDRTDGRVVIVDADGNSLADSDPTNSGSRSFADRPEFAAALNHQVVTGTRHSDSLNTDLLYVAVPISSGGDTYGAVRIVVLDQPDRGPDPSLLARPARHRRRVPHRRGGAGHPVEPVGRPPARAARGCRAPARIG